MQQSTGTEIAEINEVNEAMSKYPSNGIKWAYYKQRKVCNNIKMTKHALTVAMEFVRPNLILFLNSNTGCVQACGARDQTGTRTHPMHADLVCTTIDHVNNFCDCK